MKRYFVIFLMLSMLLCAGCTSEGTKNVKTTEASESATTQSADAPETAPSELVQLPRGLEGNWTSASVSDRGYSESITFFEDGTLSVSSLLNGTVQQTIYGTFHVDGDKIVYEITEGTIPYSGEYKYVLDGRELYLIDDDQPAHYLRTS